MFFFKLLKEQGKKTTIASVAMITMKISIFPENVIIIRLVVTELLPLKCLKYFFKRITTR